MKQKKLYNIVYEETVSREVPVEATSRVEAGRIFKTIFGEDCPITDMWELKRNDGK